MTTSSAPQAGASIPRRALARPRAGGARQEILDLLVGRLREVLVELADGREQIRRLRADDLVHLGAELVTGLGGGHRHRDHDLADAARPQGRHRRAYGGSRGQSVVDDDHGAAPDVGWGLSVSIDGFAPLQLTLFPGGHAVDHRRWNAEGTDQGGVQDPDTAARDSTHGELFAAGHAQLPHEEDVERHAQLASDLVRHGYASPRQAEDENIVTSP